MPTNQNESILGILPLLLNSGKHCQAVSINYRNAALKIINVNPSKWTEFDKNFKRGYFKITPSFPQNLNYKKEIINIIYEKYRVSKFEIAYYNIIRNSFLLSSSGQELLSSNDILVFNDYQVVAYIDRDHFFYKITYFHRDNNYSITYNYMEIPINNIENEF